MASAICFQEGMVLWPSTQLLHSPHSCCRLCWRAPDHAGSARALGTFQAHPSYRSLPAQGAVLVLMACALWHASFGTSSAEPAHHAPAQLLSCVCSQSCGARLSPLTCSWHSNQHAQCGCLRLRTLAGCDALHTPHMQSCTIM